MNLFTLLDRVIGPDSQVTFSIEKGKDGKLTVLVVPRLSATIDKLDDIDAQYRAALSMPFRLIDSAENLDASFMDTLAEYADRRRAILQDHDHFLEMKEASKSANRAAEQSLGKLSEGDNQPEPGKTFPQKESSSEEGSSLVKPVEGNTNPDNLFGEEMP